MQQEQTKVDMINSLKEYYNANNTVSSYLYAKKKLKPSYSQIVKTFGTWNSALIASGLQPMKKDRDPDTPRLTKEEILQILQKYIAKDFYMMFPTFYKEANVHPTVDTVTYHFGNWKNAMVAIGIDAYNKGLQSKTEERYYLAEDLVNEAKKKWNK